MMLVEFDNVSFSYDGTTAALDNVAFSIAPGEFICVIGGNGSGKSTLAKHMNGLLMPDAGQVRIGGAATDNPANLARIRSMVGMVFQNPDDQIVASLVEDDVAFGPENLGLEPDEIRRRVTAALARVGLQGLERRATDELSGGQKQRLAIAGVLAMEPQVLVLDEASSMLDPRGRADLMGICRELCEDGMAIVFVTHFMEQAAQADRVIALDGGTIALDGPPHDVLERIEELEALSLEPPFYARLNHELRKHGIGSIDLPSILSKTEGERGGALRAPAMRISCCDEDDPPAIEFDGVSFAYRKREGGQAALDGISVSVATGEIVGLAGPTGSGKSTFAQLAGGILAPTAGRVRTGGTDPAARKAARNGRTPGIVFQYPERQLFAPTVFDDVAFGPRNLGLGDAQIATRVREALNTVHLDPDELAQRSPFSLSGGQQRLVAIAGVLALMPQTLVLDEPTVGLDPRAKRMLNQLIRELHDDRSMTIVLISHDMVDLAALCDRIVVLDGGKITCAGNPTDVFVNGELLQRIGLETPMEIRLANALGTRPDAASIAAALA